jgi:hypothetical protein
MKFNTYLSKEGDVKVRAAKVAARNLRDYSKEHHIIGLCVLHPCSPAPCIGDWIVYFSGNDEAAVIREDIFRATYTKQRSNADDS